MFKRTCTISTIVLLIIGASCRNSEEKASSPVKTPPAVKIILDTDMGSDCDDVGALALLHHYAGQGKAEILGVIFSSEAVPFGAGIVDAINRVYDRPYIPVGADHVSGFGDPVDKMNAEKLAKDTAMFGHRIVRNVDALEQTALNRQLLSGEPDQNVTYITIGHTRGLYELLKSEPDGISELNGRELIEAKVKRWVALGALNAANEEGVFTRDWNFFFNGTAPYTKYLVDHFPRPIFFVDGGSQVLTGKSLVNLPPEHIVRAAYSEWLRKVENKSLEDQRPSWDLVTVYYAVEGEGPWLEAMDSGYLEFDPEKGCTWVKSDSASGQHFIRQIDGTDEEFADYLNARISKK